MFPFVNFSNDFPHSVIDDTILSIVFPSFPQSTEKEFDVRKMTRSQITFCSFVSITQTPLTISKSNDYEIFFSLFAYCSSTSHCGCIYAEYKSLKVSYNCYEYSYTTGDNSVIFTSNTVICFNSSSVSHCPEKKRGADDTLYFKYKTVESSHCNVSSCHCAESTGIQGSDVTSFVVSFFLGADGNGFASIELTISGNGLFEKISIINNTTTDQYGVVTLYSGKAQFSDSVFSGNIGKCFYGSNFELKNCFYYSDSPTGLNPNPPGLTILKKPTMSWVTAEFETRFCHFRRNFLTGDEMESNRLLNYCIGVSLLSSMYLSHAENSNK